MIGGDGGAMGALAGFMVGLGVVVAGLVAVVGRRGRRGSAEQVEGILIEQQARREVEQVRSEVLALHAHAGVTGSFGSSRLTRR
ncbi:hypothetical protein AB0M57_19955 [Streptomyces sp. NPDC051597]|uniref:hypothetical protein n=1 Tax=Streptomyces sp. NPDC051597 TaxID=3155049 RepID=UPI003431B543